MLGCVSHHFAGYVGGITFPPTLYHRQGKSARHVNDAMSYEFILFQFSNLYTLLNLHLISIETAR